MGHYVHSVSTPGRAPDLSAGNCRDHDPEIFFPDCSSSSADKIRALVAPAQRICRGCPVRNPCGEWAISAKVQGIWGGMTEAQRKALAS